MDTNRFKRRTDYAMPVKRPAPVLDELGELRQPVVPVASALEPVVQAVQPPPKPPAPVYSARPVSTPVARPAMPTRVPVSFDDETPAPVVSTPSSVYSEPPAPQPAPPSVAPAAMIDLSKPDTGGWLDEIAPETSRDEPSLVNEGAGEAVAQLPTTVSINISMPKIKLPEPHLPAWPYRKIAIWTGVGVASALLITVGVIVAMHFLKKPPPVVSLTPSQKLAASLVKPTFTPVAPKDKAGLAAGQAGTTFDTTRDVYSFNDSLNGTPIIVSQQPVPAKFNSTTEAVSAIAKSMNAKTTFNTKWGKVYEAVDSKSGAQTLVLAVNDVLIFIQNGYPHSTADWTNYINNLK